MWSYSSDDSVTVQHFYRITHDKLWKVLFKKQNTWPPEEKDLDIYATNPPGEIWLEKCKRLNFPAPLPEGPRTTLLTVLLVKNPYTMPKKEEKKESRGGIRSKGPPKTRFEDTHIPSTLEGEQEEGEEERGSSHTKKRVCEDIGEI
ncbi:e3 ubiquitin-protein ligase ari8 [Hordeum vulgare]|nr:e3 ubiquitin-protein ligase ari8 [Hordeum vulgare]